MTEQEGTTLIGFFVAGLLVGFVWSVVTDLANYISGRR